MSFSGMCRIVACLALLVGALPARAETEMEAWHRALALNVVQTAAGQTVHFSISFTVPPVLPNGGPYNLVLAYRMLILNGVRYCPITNSSPCDTVVLRQTEARSPGERVQLELDLPKGFVNTDGAMLLIGVGNSRTGYRPVKVPMTKAP